MWKTLFFIFITMSANAKLVQYDVYGSNKFYFSFRQVCEHYRAALSLIETPDANTVTCMGQSFDIQKFCQDKYKKDNKYARAYIDNKNERVICQTARRIVLKYKCKPNSNSVFCRQADQGCSSMKKALAHNLDLVHKSLTKRDDASKELNCYFDNDVALNSF